MTIPQRVFLVDTYVPGIDPAKAYRLLDRLNAADERIRWLYALAIPEEETLTCVVTSPGDDELLVILHDAGLDLDHVADAYLLPRR